MSAGSSFAEALMWQVSLTIATGIAKACSYPKHTFVRKKLKKINPGMCLRSWTTPRCCGAVQVLLLTRFALDARGTFHGKGCHSPFLRKVILHMGPSQTILLSKFSSFFKCKKKKRNFLLFSLNFFFFFLIPLHLNPLQFQNPRDLQET